MKNPYVPNLYNRDQEPKLYSLREWEGPAKHKFSI